MTDYDDPGWLPVLKRIAKNYFMPWRWFFWRTRRELGSSALVPTRYIFVGLCASSFLILYVLTFIVTKQPWASPGGSGLVAAAVGALSLAGVTLHRRGVLDASSAEALMKSWRAALFIEIGIAMLPCYVAFVITLVANRLWVYVIGLAFVTAGLLLAAPSQWNIERRRRQIDAAGSSLSLGALLTQPSRSVGRTAKTVEPRDLSDNERGILVRILSEVAFDGSHELLSQVGSARITGGLPMFVDLSVDRSSRPARIKHAPVPVRAVVEGASGEVEGEILVWVTDGYLSGLEFAWVTDEMPRAMPSPERLRIEPETP
jgi:hypothetical protein